MSRTLFNDILDDFDFDNDNKTSTRSKPQKSTAHIDDWFDFDTDTKPSTTNLTQKRPVDINDDLEQDDGLNQTGGSNAIYFPSFGGTGTLTNTLPNQGLDTIQRIVNQPRPATVSGSRKFDDLFGSSPPKVTSSIDADKNKKSVRFDDFDLVRPTVAPSSADTTQTRSNTIGGISSLRTGLEPSKTTTESSKSHDWLGLKDESSNEDEPLPRPASKIEPVITTIAKKTPILPVQEPLPPSVPEPPKKSIIDELLDDDRRVLSEKTTITPVVITNNTSATDFWLDDRTTLNKRPATAGPIKTSSFTDNQLKGSTKSDFADIVFKDTSKDTFFTPELQTRGTSSSVNLEMKKLEFENNELKMTVDHMKRQHEIEIAMLEEGYKHRLEYAEKTCERRESRLKEENEHLLRQLNDRTQQYENEKSTLLLDHQRRLDDLQRDRTTELENLRTLQRQTLEHLRREHEQTIQRLKQLKQEELSTALDVTTHTRAFESVVDHMEQNAKNIDALRLKLESKHQSILTDKEIETRAKEQHLKAYEERLQAQASDFERERKNLQELISRLEVHLSEQTKLVEEERWKALQAQKRMEAMQDALNGEQRLFTEKIARDRADIQRSKDQLLEDQKIALASIYETRAQLADERAKIEALQKNFQEQKHRDMLQNASIEAETRAQQKLVAEQIQRLDKREQELIKREEALLLEKRSLTELKQRLDIEKSTLQTQQDDYKQKLYEIEHANESIKKERERLSQLYFELHALDGKNTGRLQQLQKSISTLRQQEEQMGQQYTKMNYERDNLNHLRSSMTYKKSTPIVDSGFSTLQLASTSPLLPTNINQQSIDESAVLRTLRMDALQDQLYIQDEMSFLNNLRTNQHLTSRSVSLSNLHRQTDRNLLRTNQ